MREVTVEYRVGEWGVGSLALMSDSTGTWVGIWSRETWMQLYDKLRVYAYQLIS